MDSLYSKPLSLLIGAVVGSGICIIAALTTGNVLLQLAAWAVGLVAALRVAILVGVRRTGWDNTRAIEILFEIGAFAYAAALSVVAVIAIADDISPEAELLLVVVVVSYATAIAARNAGRPVIALVQMLLVLAPLGVAMLLSGTPLIQVLGVAVLLHILSTISITINVYRSLRKSISEAKKSAELADKMEKLARTDVVTGLLNRAGLNHYLTEGLLAVENDRKLALIWIDLDRFKFVNDTLGHQVGDKVLAHVARRLREEAPGTSIIARFGGDEFIVAFEAETRDEIERMGQKLQDALTRPYRFQGERIEIGTSMGIAMLPDDAKDLDPLLQAADLALYHAKVNGRNQIAYYHPSMNHDLMRRREIEAELRQAVERDELSVFFQPIVDLETGKIRCFEALVRWFHPEKGEMKPDEFIPVAEETGAIVALGTWITAQAARTAANWPDHVSLAVNLSPLQIRAPGAAQGILSAIKEAGLDPHRLELEITETVLLDHDHTTEAFIAQLSQAGVRFVLDDFGTGYSSLGYLHKYPFGKIKVDRSFVSGSHVGKKSEAIIRAVSEMGTTLGMEIVAEGIETIEQVRTVRESGCTLGQGYYFSRAVPDYLATMLLAREADDDGTGSQRVAS